LGYTYHLIPFIEMCTRGDIGNADYEALSTKEARCKPLSGIGGSQALGSLLEENGVFLAGDDADKEASERVQVAVRLISILHALGFKFPVEMAMETAMSEMTPIGLPCSLEPCQRED
jgi:hypothetical protein